VSKRFELASLLSIFIIATSAIADIADDTDGRLEAAEWAGASNLLELNRTTLLAQSDGKVLRVAVRSSQLGILTVWVSDGQRVRLLHASAAIGEAVYERRDDGAFRLTKEFAWDRGDDAESRRAHFQEHGWVASITPNWDRGDREFVLDLSRLSEGSRIAVSFGAGEKFDTLFVWPNAVKDDTRLGDMQRGNLRARARFEPKDWAAIVQRFGAE